VRQMAAKLVGDVRDASEKMERDAATALQQDAGASAAAELKSTTNADAIVPARSSALHQIENEAQEAAVGEHSAARPHGHGGALPR
jgi:hypothetical protein